MLDGVREFTPAILRGDRVRAEDEDEVVRRLDARVDGLQPLLRVQNAPAVDPDLSAALTQGLFEPAHERRVFARVGDEQVQLEVGVHPLE